MIRFKTLFITLIFCLLNIPEYAQSYNVKNYTADNGLPSSEVYQVVQDKEGFIWFATDEGVSRYNGYSFENYTNVEGLPDNTVLEIYEDYKGRIWFISISGRLSWYENNIISVYPYNDLIENRLSGSNFPIKRSFYIDTLDNVYIGFYNYHILKITSEGEVIEYGQNTINNEINFIDDQVICNYKGSVRKVIVNYTLNDTLHFDLNEIDRGTNRAFVYSFQKNLLYSEDKSLYIIDSLRNKRIISFSKPIIWISTDKNGLFWIGLLKDGAKAFKNLDFENKIYHLAKGMSVSSVLDDNEHGFWITTLENGAFYYPALNVNNISEKDGLNNSVINELAIRNQKIYFGGDSLKYYEYNLKTLKEYELRSNLNPRSCKMLRWIGDTLVIANSMSGTHFFYNNEIVYHYPSAIREIIKVNKDTSVFFYLNIIRYNNSIDSDYLDLKNVSQIFDATFFNDSIILLGTDEGLYQFNYRTKYYKKVVLFKEFNSRINTLFKENNILWIGTKGNGLLKYDGDTLYKYNIKDGLPGNSVNSIIKNNDEYIIGTNNGIVKINFSNNNKINDLTIFNSGHGLIKIGVNDVKILGDKIFVATNKGISYFDKDFNGLNSPIYITNCKIASKDTTLQYFYELRHNQNFIEISFVSLNYKRTKPIKYFYKLDGVDKDWQQTEDLTVRYALLPPGYYKFMVKSINSYGKESDEPAALSFKIDKAYYQTILFKIGILLLSIFIVALIVFFIFRIRLRELRNRNQMENELNRFRQKALSAQMNPHFIYNSLNSVQNYILKNDRLKSNEYLSRFGNLMRRVLDNSQSSSISLKEELEALKLYVELELIRFQNSFEFELNVHDSINLEKIKVPPLILQPFVENSIHHGLRSKNGIKKVNIKIFKKEEKIHIHIEDNGIGRAKAKMISKRKTYKSYGTNITSKRLNIYSNLYNNDIKVNIIDLYSINNLSTGTRVEIEFINI